MQIKQTNYGKGPSGLETNAELFVKKNYYEDIPKKQEDNLWLCLISSSQ